jgi:hypothetical protein
MLDASCSRRQIHNRLCIGTQRTQMVVDVMLWLRLSNGVPAYDGVEEGLMSP